MNKVLIYLILLLAPIASFASYTGNSCIDYNGDLSSNDLSYLRQKTLYGYVLNIINMKQIDSCDASDDELKICVKQTGATNWNNCSPQTLHKGSSILVSSLNNDALKIDLLANVSLSTQIIDGADLLCVTIDTIYGQMPLVCKNTITKNNQQDKPGDDTKSCASSACAMNITSSNSQLLLNFSGRMMQCVRESLDGIFFDQTLCPDNFDLNNFSTVTNYLKQTIFALLGMYTIFYGIKVVMGPDKFKLEEAVLFVVKMLMVIYFTVGFQFTSIFADKVTQKPQNGIIDILLPMFRSISTDLSQIVLSAAKSNSQGPGLCEFDPKSYAQGYDYFAMFDAIDCRVGYFLGYGMLYDSFKNVSAQSNSFPTNGFLIFKVIAGLALSSPILVIFNLLFVYLFLYTLVVRFVGMFVVYTISLYAMFFISPIFIPMALFEQTKQMFQGWLRTTLSFALQPAIIAAFMTMMLTIYDQALYGNCTFKRHTYPYQNSIITTFEPNIPSSDNETCSKSYGYKLYELYSGQAWSTKTYSFFKFPIITPDKDFYLSALKALIISFIIYKFAIDAQNIAAELTGGVSLSLNSGEKDQKSEKDENKDGAQDKAKSGKTDGAQDKAKSGKGADASDKAASGARAGISK